MNTFISPEGLAAMISIAEINAVKKYHKTEKLKGLKKTTESTIEWLEKTFDMISDIDQLKDQARDIRTNIEKEEALLNLINEELEVLGGN